VYVAKQKLQALESRDAELARINAAFGQAGSGNFSPVKKLSPRSEVISATGKGGEQATWMIWDSSIEFDVALTAATEPAATAWNVIEFQFAPNLVANAGQGGCGDRHRRAKWRRVMLALKRAGGGG